MPPTLYRDTGYTLRHLIENIEGGRIGLPDIQRPFVWSAAKTRDLFDSMYRGYPIGTLMFWETGAEVGTRQIGTEAGDRAPQLLVVDGQQRLTALYAVLTGRKIVTKSFDEINVRIAFHPEDQTFEVTDAAIERDAHFIPDITALWAQGGYKPTVRQFFQRLDQASGQPLSDAAKDELEERVDRVRDLHEFRFQVVELGASANEEQVADIFVRINSEGVKLNQSDAGRGHSDDVARGVRGDVAHNRDAFGDLRGRCGAPLRHTPELLVEFGGALGTVLVPEPVALGDIARQIKGEGLDSVRQALRACLARMPQWTERSLRTLAEVRYASHGTMRPEAVALREAFDQAATGRTTAAADRLQRTVNDLEGQRCGAGCGNRRPPTCI